MSTILYFGAPLLPEQVQAILVKRSLPSAFRSALSDQAPSWSAGQGGGGWVGFEVSGLPSCPLLLSEVVNPDSPTRARWDKFRSFTKLCAHLDLPEGVLFLVCTDTEDE